ncbi:hypothetical protein TNCV_2830241 [Trichonephila clavipes]|nr:hypothetical protein TNCV_2830241 [Trichonephila clavipes]
MKRKSGSDSILLLPHHINTTSGEDNRKITFSAGSGGCGSLVTNPRGHELEVGVSWVRILVLKTHRVEESDAH